MLEASEEDPRVAASYVIHSFPSAERYNASNIRSFIEAELSKKEEVVNKVMKQYYNKQFQGEQAFMVPKYHPETGNWDDK